MSKPILTAYKIRRPSDGKFKLSGMIDCGGKTGKTWSSRGAILLHLAQLQELLYLQSDGVTWGPRWGGSGYRNGIHFYQPLPESRAETLEETVTRIFQNGETVIEVQVFSDLSSSVREIPILDFINS